MNAMAVLEDHASEFRALGARGEAHTGSDIDVYVYVYVEFEESRRTYDNFFALHELLEDLFQRRVDLVTDKSLSETKAQLILPTVRYAASHP